MVSVMLQNRIKETAPMVFVVSFANIVNYPSLKSDDFEEGA